ncbi:MAG TPA: NrfD/PsrC family molybdoenzyme membrane anchor subunit [Gemmataceae bacterium]|nr:NrfD/PsrC family molybdoenzyme membrane anchor subunit [Gemmataceae bacterium]
MNLFVADPEWGWWIVFYFFVGGIAAGAYFLASLIELVGGPLSGDLPRVGYWIAFPLVLLCGILLTVDLERPDRFWHMLVRSEKVHEALNQNWPSGGWDAMLGAPLLKRWSPMSVGSWALAVFGLCSGLSFLGSLRSEGLMVRLLRQSWFGRILQLVGSLVGFFVAAYTGTLLSATNQPLWSDTPWVAPLFLTSAASTGAATMLLLSRLSGVGCPEAAERLERVDVLALILELLVFAGLLVSLATWFKPIWDTPQGKLLVVAVPAVGILLPLAFYLAGHLNARRAPATLVLAALFSLAGGMLLRYAILKTPREILAERSSLISTMPEPPYGTPGSGAAWLGAISPEDGRQSGQAGADPVNRAGELQPRTKIPGLE